MSAAMIDTLLVFHITGIVFWMGTLMLLTRIKAFGAEQEAAVQGPFQALSKKLFFGGIVPGIALVLLTGFTLLAAYDWAPLDAKAVGPRFHIKLTLVFVLLVLSGVVFKADLTQKPAKHFKMLHGVVATLFLAVLFVFFMMKR